MDLKSQFSPWQANGAQSLRKTIPFTPSNYFCYDDSFHQDSTTLYWVICHPLTYPAWKDLQDQSTLCSGHACALCTLTHREVFWGILWHMCILRFSAKVKEMERNLLMLLPPSGGISVRHFIYSDRNLYVSKENEMLPSSHVLNVWFQVYACRVPGLAFLVFWSCPEERNKINIAITLRLVTELGDIMQLYVPILLLTLCFLSFFLLFVCLSLSLSPVAALLLHGCPDRGVRCGCWLLLWDTTWRQVAILFPFPQVSKSSPA